MLVLMVNLVLVTIELSVFNVCLLLTFSISALKFYKSYLMEKNVDEL